jgi:DNA polymerase III delta subunit
LHGEDCDGRRAAIIDWKATHVDHDWGAFSFSVCNESCSWSEIINALRESAPLGADRVVLAPQVDNLFEHGKKLPKEAREILESPIPDTRLLLVACGVISTSTGSLLNSKPFSDWNKHGAVLKIGLLDSKEIVGWIENVAKDINLRLDVGVASQIADQIGNNPGILRRALEFLELTCEGKDVVTIDHVYRATFRIGERSAFAWVRSWQSGSILMGLRSLRQSLEDDPSSGRHLMLIGQARRELERLCCLSDARRLGIKNRSEILLALGLNSRQDFLLGTYSRVLDKIGNDGMRRLLKLINQVEIDIKGQAIFGCSTALINLTVALCKAWGK